MTRIGTKSDVLECGFEVGDGKGAVAHTQNKPGEICVKIF